MREIILKKRYPHSREEDITDAFMRGYVKGKADRPKGEWKPLDRTWGRETWYCTNCEDAVVDMPTYMGIALYNYCPNCGCRMKGADDDSDNI
jgi:hypothetical protein